jgi:poly(3-hydroxybutyrate) depolymerase
MPKDHKMYPVHSPMGFQAMKVFRFGTTLAPTLLLLLALQGDASGTRELPAYQVDLQQTTVSGLSSGAFMAAQFAVAYSGIVRGAGIVAGGPYYCAGFPGDAPFIAYLYNATGECMNPGQADVAPPDALVSWGHAQEFAHQGLIDDVANLRRQSVYLFSGTQDSTVTRAVVDQARRFFELAGAHPIRFVDNVDAGHGMVTNRRTDGACALTAPPYFNNCGIDQARDILATMYADLKPPAVHLSGKTIRFNQTRFARTAPSMSETAYAYVPASCATHTCRVHVAFHGCHQGAAEIGNHFYAHAGYNEVADTNNIIVLYPQVEASPIYPYNPKGCWDFWGYTSADPFAPNFFARDGAQMAAVRAMLARLAQARGSPLR